MRGSGDTAVAFAQPAALFDVSGFLVLSSICSRSHARAVYAGLRLLLMAYVFMRDMTTLTFSGVFHPALFAQVFAVRRHIGGGRCAHAGDIGRQYGAVPDIRHTDHKEAGQRHVLIKSGAERIGERK